MPSRKNSEIVEGDPQQAVPFDRYRFELRLAEAVRFPFEHGGILRGLVSAVLDRHRLPKGLMPFACEAGRVSFEAGDCYAFLVTLAGGALRHADELIAGLERVVLGDAIRRRCSAATS